MGGQISGFLEHRLSGIMKVHSVQVIKPKLGPEQHGKLDQKFSHKVSVLKIQYVWQVNQGRGITYLCPNSVWSEKKKTESPTKNFYLIRLPFKSGDRINDTFVIKIKRNSQNTSGIICP